MKILILTNNVKNIDNIKAGLKLAQDRAKTVGYNLEYTFKQTDKIFTGETFNNPAVGVGAAVNPQQILAEVDGAIGYKVACLIFDWNNVLPKPTNPVHHGTTKNRCTPIQIPEQWCGTPLHPEVLCQYFLHELCHAGFFFAGKNDTTHAYLPEFGQKQRYEYYLFLLKDLKPFLEVEMPKTKTPSTPSKPSKPITLSTPSTPMPYKYFSSKEIVGLKPELVAMLDKARGIAGIPFNIVSGFRTPENNSKLKGSVKDSAHLVGLAVDIECKDSSSRFKVLDGLIKAGFTRIGFGKTFLHADCDASKPQQVMWTYTS